MYKGKNQKIFIAKRSVDCQKKRGETLPKIQKYSVERGIYGENLIEATFKSGF